MTSNQAYPQPGLIILFGSGETSPTGRKIFDRIFQSLPQSPRLALLETPAGFELNSPQVIGRVGEFFAHRFQNYSPQVEIVSARRRGSKYSPDNPAIVAPLLSADLIFMGPGSPSYAIRQLHDSLAWYYLIARHRLGAVLALASAATVAFSACSLPVYEIYKVGEDLHWIEGLDFFKLYGLQLVFIPHWNNNEGGSELDTSRCFMGQERFVHLIDMLPDEMTIVGLDEKTALIMDPSNSDCQVSGLGTLTLLHTGHMHSRNVYQPLSPSPENNLTGSDEGLVIIAEQRGGHIHRYHAGQNFPMSELGPYHPFHPEASLPSAIWQQALQAGCEPEPEANFIPPQDIMQLILAREKARHASNWSTADELREQIEHLGWQVLDTKDGPVIKKA